MKLAIKLSILSGLIMIILGLGSNIGNPLSNLRSALERLRFLDDLDITQVSPIYESDALLPDGAPSGWNRPYLNCALKANTSLLPDELLTQIKKIEQDLERQPGKRWAPRIIDIDILAWNEECYHTERLTIPKEGLLERPFALWPLADLAPNWHYCKPGLPETGKSAATLAKKFGSRFDRQAPLNTRQINHRIDIPIIFGILNLTPDSFSDGGKFNYPKQAMIQAKSLFEAGADVIDLGAESTRPNGQAVSVTAEWQRIKPVLDLWPELWAEKNFRPQLSIDTRKPELVKKLLTYPVDFFNDVSGLTDPQMIAAIKESQARVIYMHNLGIPVNPKITLSEDSDPVFTVYEWARAQLEKLIKVGIAKERLIFDVGIGFGKDADQSLALINGIKQFRQLGIPIMVGHSRKSFFNRFTARDFSQRDLETIGVSQFLAKKKVNFLRVHDVEQHLRILKINQALCDLS